MTLSPPPEIFEVKAPPPPPGEVTAGQQLAQEGLTLTVAQLDSLRELRAEVQDLGNLLNHVRNGQAILKTYAGYIQKTRTDIDALMEELSGGDTLRHLSNAWEQMSANPLLVDPEQDFAAQDQLHHLSLLEEQIHTVIFLVGLLTIPSRVNHWLQKARPGYYIPFHLVFEDELPLAEDRLRLLNFLTWSPETLKGGIVDTANGLIYRYSENPTARLASIGLAALGLIVSVLLVIGSSRLAVQGWPLQQGHLPMLLAGWGAVLAGVVTHMGVGNVKRSQQQGGLPPILSLGDLPLLIDARVGQILFKLLLALVGFFGLVFASGIQELTAMNAFLVGYSLDSFTGLFVSSVEQRATAQVASLKQQLSPG